MARQRTDRLNSLLREVLSEVITKDVRNPSVCELTTVSRVDITKDLHYAKVYVSIIGTDRERAKTVRALQSASGFISVTASKKVVMRHFPELTFILDDGAEKHMRMEELLAKVEHERDQRDEGEQVIEESASADGE